MTPAELTEIVNTLIVIVVGCFYLLLLLPIGKRP